MPKAGNSLKNTKYSQLILNLPIEISKFHKIADIHKRMTNKIEPANFLSVKNFAITPHSFIGIP